MCLRLRVLTPSGSTPVYLSATEVQGSLIFSYCSMHMTLGTPDSFHTLSPPFSVFSFWLSGAMALVSNTSKLLFNVLPLLCLKQKLCLGGHASSAFLSKQDCSAFPRVLTLPSSPLFPLCTSQIALLPTVASNS